MRLKSPAARVPQSLDEADAMLARLGALAREKALIQAQLDEDTAHAKAVAERAAAPIDAEVLEKTLLLKAWAEANRDALTHGGKTKTVKLPAGRVCWREGRPRLVVADEAAAVAYADAAGDFERFLTRKVALSKAALLKAPEDAARLPGVAILPGAEEFIAEPVEQDLASGRAS